MARYGAIQRKKASNTSKMMFSGISRPLREYIQSADVSVSATNKTKLTISISENGVIQGFLSSVNIYSVGLGSAGYGENINVIVRRNGATIHTSHISLRAFYENQKMGLAYYETLNFLSGAEVQSGEVFEMEINYNPSAGGSIGYLANFNMVVKNIPSSYP